MATRLVVLEISMDEILYGEPNQDSWDALISNIKADVHGRQQIAYKLQKQFKKAEKYNARLHKIDKNSWIRHYKDLWTDKEVSNT